ncbi:MAG: DUF1934 domain-containing protein [Bacillota bacterium]
MSEKVKINIVNRQKTAEGDTDCLKQQVEGTLYRKNSVYYLVYDEKSEGLEGVRTTLKIEPEVERFFLIRSKPLRYKQSFCKRERTTGQYQTVHGSIQTEIETDRLDFFLKENRGRIILEYKLYLAGEMTAYNKLEISYYTEGVEDFAE